jgi:hypothetical protein
MGKRCAEVAGFNVHANVRVGANDRDGLEHLCRYLARPPIANDRLQELPDGRIALRFKQAWRDGTSSVQLAPLALIARLAALVVPAGPRAYPPCPCPTRLRRARRQLHGGILFSIVVCFPRTPLRAKTWFPPLPTLRHPALPRAGLEPDPST